MELLVYEQLQGTLNISLFGEDLIQAYLDLIFILIKGLGIFLGAFNVLFKS